MVEDQFNITKINTFGGEPVLPAFFPTTLALGLNVEASHFCPRRFTGYRDFVEPEAKGVRAKALTPTGSTRTISREPP